jgi:hypothetical protein
MDRELELLESRDSMLPLSDLFRVERELGCMLARA